MSRVEVGRGSLGKGALVASLTHIQGRVVSIVEAPENAGLLREAIDGAECVMLVPARGHSVAAQARAVAEACRDWGTRTPHLGRVTFAVPIRTQRGYPGRPVRDSQGRRRP